MDNETLTTIYALRQILDNLPPEKLSLKLTGVSFGKTIKNYPLKSKSHTLTQQEITMFTRQLMKAYKGWAEAGHKDWIVRESPGVRFCVLFIRKGHEGPRPLTEIYKKQKNGRKP